MTDTIKPRVIDPPAEIWLVYGDIEHDDTHRECCASGEVTWCEDGQFDADVRYVRADLLDAAVAQERAEAERLRAALNAMQQDYLDTAMQAAQAALGEP